MALLSFFLAFSILRLNMCKDNCMSATCKDSRLYCCFIYFLLTFTLRKSPGSGSVSTCCWFQGTVVIFTGCLVLFVFQTENWDFPKIRTPKCWPRITQDSNSFRDNMYLSSAYFREALTVKRQDRYFLGVISL